MSHIVGETGDMEKLWFGAWVGLGLLHELLVNNPSMKDQQRAAQLLGTDSILTMDQVPDAAKKLLGL